MIIEYSNLTAEEAEQIYAIEDEFPECVVRDITSSFDGLTTLQLLTPENVKLASDLIEAILNATALIVSANITAKAVVEAARISADNGTMENKAKEKSSKEERAEKSATAKTSKGEEVKVVDNEDLKTFKNILNNCKDSLQEDEINE